MQGFSKLIRDLRLAGVFCGALGICLISLATFAQKDNFVTRKPPDPNLVSFQRKTFVESGDYTRELFEVSEQAYLNLEVELSRERGNFLVMVVPYDDLDLALLETEHDRRRKNYPSLSVEGEFRAAIREDLPAGRYWAVIRNYGEKGQAFSFSLRTKSTGDKYHEEKTW